MRKSPVSYTLLKQEYLSGKKLTHVCKEYHVAPVYLSRLLKADGIEVKKFPLTGNKCSCVETLFDMIDTEEKAYWLGFAFAEGTLYKSNKGNTEFSIELSQLDIAHLEKLKAVLKAKVQINKRTRQGVTKKIHLCRLKLGSKHLCNSLSKYFPYGLKCDIIEMPGLREDLNRHFIRGFFDGDGSIAASNGAISFTSTSKKMLKAIAEILQKSLGLISNIRTIDRAKENRKTIYKITNGKKAEVLKLLSYLYDGASVYLDRKFSLYRKLVCPPS